MAASMYRLSKSVVQSSKSVGWALIHKLFKNVDFCIEPNPVDNFEDRFLSILSVNALTYTFKHESIFCEKTINMENLQNRFDPKDIGEVHVLQLLKKGETHNTRSILKIDLNKQRIFRSFLTKLPATGMIFLAVFAIIIKKRLVLRLQDAFFFSYKYPTRLDLSIENVEVNWGPLDFICSRQLILIESQDNKMLTLSNLELLSDLAKAESVQLCINYLSSTSNPGSRLSHDNFKVNTLTFQSKFELLKYAANQKGIFIVESNLSMLVALLASDKIVLTNQKYRREDLSWGRLSVIN